MLQNGVYPHVALAVMESLNPELEKDLIQIAEVLSPFPLSPSDIASFQTDPTVVYSGFKRIGALEKVHVDVLQAMAKACVKCHDYYTVERWKPHCTLAMQFPLALAKQTIEAAKAQIPTLPYVVESMGVIMYPPTKRLSHLKLRDQR